MDLREGAILSINKPLGMTSFAAVAFVRCRLCRAVGVKKIKIGHAGTLDPLATGVLVLCTGKATKSISTLQECEKEYVCTIQFGATTASYDLEQPLSGTFPTDGVSRASLLATLPSFVGDILQTPPLFSAVKSNGRRAYQYARKEEPLTLSPKRVHISSLSLVDYDDDKKTATLRVSCGKGTYIRALARDIGEALHSGAYLSSLCRTRVGPYTLAASIAIDDFSAWLSQQTLAPYDQ